jgi:cell division protein ZapE
MLDSKILKYIPSSVNLSLSQLELIIRLEHLEEWLNKHKILKLFSNPKYNGIYIYGKVGRGKTMISNAFFNSIECRKQQYHYQSFIKWMHEQVHILNKKQRKNAVEKLSRDIAENFDMVFIDEIEIKDVTDAFFVQRFVKELICNGVFIIFTSNTKPDDLYKDGIQREQAQKLIDKLNSEFLVHNLDDEKDYRLSKICDDKKLISYGISSENQPNFDNIVNELTKNKKFEKTNITSFGRKIEFKNSYKDVLLLQPEEVINDKFSKNEYQEIAKKFSVVIIDFKKYDIIGADDAIKFINLIDNLYANKVLLLATFSKNPEDLYNDKRYETEMGRAKSRLVEMASKEYVLNSKYYNK